MRATFFYTEIQKETLNPLLDSLREITSVLSEFIHKEHCGTAFILVDWHQNMEFDIN